MKLVKYIGLAFVVVLVALVVCLEINNIFKLVWVFWLMVLAWYILKLKVENVEEKRTYVRQEFKEKEKDKDKPISSVTFYVPKENKPLTPIFLTEALCEQGYNAQLFGNEIIFTIEGENSIEKWLILIYNLYNDTKLVNIGMKFKIEEKKVGADQIVAYLQGCMLTPAHIRFKQAENKEDVYGEMYVFEYEWNPATCGVLLKKLPEYIMNVRENSYRYFERRQEYESKAVYESEHQYLIRLFNIVRDCKIAPEVLTDEDAIRQIMIEDIPIITDRWDSFCIERADQIDDAHKLIVYRFPQPTAEREALYGALIYNIKTLEYEYFTLQLGSENKWIYCLVSEDENHRTYENVCASENVNDFVEFVLKYNDVLRKSYLNNGSRTNVVS